MKDIKIIFENPLDKETVDLLVRSFDRRNIHLREGHGWWSTATEEDKPSYKDNIKIDEDGTIHLSGSDHTEGRVRTHLDISNDRKSINVDYDWNYSYLEGLLEERGINYEIKKPLGM